MTYQEVKQYLDKKRELNTYFITGKLIYHVKEYKNLTNIDIDK